ncbi:RDD family protein [Rossellomorea aquimaris]|uniref:RDD family protein n=1 Tax=Rossellomorea aquimaris TaxID=189382 RepID=UPI001CD3CA35|nr:RDD family protein [Rossellomorea aquimaris]MCA1057482.1 RDD family protein [Rossellomorea aquimaris]
MDYIWSFIILVIMGYFLRLQIRSEYELESIRTFHHHDDTFIRAGLTRKLLSSGIDLIPLFCFYSILDQLGISPLVKLLSTLCFVITYYILFIRIITQTLGHKLLKIKVIPLKKDQNLTMKQILKRIIFHIVLFPLMIFQIPFLRSQKKPFLADKCSNTELVQVTSGLGEKWINR